MFYIRKSTINIAVSNHRSKRFTCHSYISNIINVAFICAKAMLGFRLQITTLSLWTARNTNILQINEQKNFVFDNPYIWFYFSKWKYHWFPANCSISFLNHYSWHIVNKCLAKKCVFIRKTIQNMQAHTNIWLLVHVCK